MSAEAARAAELLTQLSHPARLRAFAGLVGRGSEGFSIAEMSFLLDMSKPEAGEALGRLAALGLASGTGDGYYRATPQVLRDAAQALVATLPIAPLLREYPQLKGYFTHGFLTSLPPTLSERYEQIGELLARFLAVEGVLTEDEVNRRIAVVAEDVAAVRRMLVETGWLERDRAGTAYGAGRVYVG
ncbi:hypothetical protein ACWT_2245 [Actinoplanes sp. SE50]|uniref:DUF2087 domain-containing protein n=1 Tax=unclassified Actinoplanes TaxID=2626549 RepID=UPI00023ED00D|nr:MULTISPECIES: DUF2087 domain-containing protein [unclassified Actinoplanes]AEV83267.1 hypothetical protein ACPL_2372 [Actinoplanes sp. SE50/110]ATO81660.1 hypothetical protein ACWT_2245 [Actinoplanes sp. SE50]SLL99068.1 uncharacterized protein ACSP50_2296 [Actinoplanes sp. SE50/110]